MFSRIVERAAIVNIVCQPHLLSMVQMQAWCRCCTHVTPFLAFKPFLTQGAGIANSLFTAETGSRQEANEQTKRRKGSNQTRCFQIYVSSSAGDPCICPLPALSKPREGSLWLTRLINRHKVLSEKHFKVSSILLL